MMMQVKNCRVLVLCTLFLLALTGCKDKNAPASDPFVTPGNVENPNWKVTVENEMPSSLTAIVKVSFAEKEGVLAAFMGNECCGIGEYIDGLYWLYVSPASEAGGNIQLKFYSPELKHIYAAKETFPYRNDDNLGSVSQPYTPEWVCEE